MADALTTITLNSLPKVSQGKVRYVFCLAPPWPPVRAGLVCSTWRDKSEIENRD